MADDEKKDADQGNIDSIINDLTERKSDEKNSLHKKRPSPNSKKNRQSVSGQQRAQKQTENCSQRSKSQRARHNQPPSDTSQSNDNTASDDSRSCHTTHSDISGNLETSQSEDGQENDPDNDDGHLKPKIRKTLPNSSKTASNNCPITNTNVNTSLTNKKFIDKFKNVWHEGDTIIKRKLYNDDNVTLISDPFKICVMQNFIDNKEFIRQLLDEMCEMEWQRKQMDLYEFHQTTDITNLTSDTKPALKLFHDLLKTTMLPWMREISGLDLSYVSVSCSMYNYGDFLLIHDDLLTDRQIAFVYYVSPWQDAECWTNEMGGALELFGCDSINGRPKYPIVKKIPPKNNQFTFFRVCEKSFHQVGEVTNLVYPRLTINGWFHGRSTDANNKSTTNESSTSNNDNDASASSIENVNNTSCLQYHSPIIEEIDLSEWINASYLEDDLKKCIQHHVEQSSEASLELFLIPDFYDLLVSEFRDNNELEWQLEGPADQRKYETLRLTSHSTGPPKDLHTLFCSKAMFYLLKQYTELDLDGPNSRRPQCSVQICRFTQGCYTLLGDSSTFSENALDIVLFFNAKNNVGTVTYLSPQLLDNDGDESTDADVSTVLENSAPTKPTGSADKSSTSGIGKKLSSKCKEKEDILNHTGSSASTTARAISGDDTDSSIKSLEIQEDVLLTLPRQNFHFTRKRRRSDVSSGDDDDDDDNDHDNNDDDDDDDDDEEYVCDENDESDGSSEEEENDDDDDDDDDDEMNSGGEICDILQREQVLLTIHPKNNALNLVYRTTGQTKFVRYVSKNCIQPDEYVYILFATYRE